MERVVSFLFFALLFYLMMRFGCGAHAVHGHGRHEQDSALPSAGSKDPVCGMDVPAGQGYSAAVRGKQYRFCSRNCLERFDAHRERYVPAPEEGKG